MPPNIHLDLVPAKCPELNPQENVWQFLRDNWLSNQIFKSYDDVVDHCCEATDNLTSINLADHVHRPSQLGPWVLINESLGISPCCGKHPVETTLSTRKWDFRGTSISDFFNNIRGKAAIWGRGRVSIGVGETGGGVNSAKRFLEETAAFFAAAMMSGGGGVHEIAQRSPRRCASVLPSSAAARRE